jgi:peroxiredoxin
MMRVLASILISALALFAAGDFSNRRAPGFSLADSHFQQHDPQDYRGKVVLIDFMETTCAICTQLADTLVQVKSKYGDKVAILSVLTLPDNYQTVDKFAAAHKIPWPMLLDSGQVMASYLKITPANPTVRFPHLFIVDGKGMIRSDFEGAEDIGAISGEIDRLLK